MGRDKVQILGRKAAGLGGVKEGEEAFCGGPFRVFPSQGVFILLKPFSNQQLFTEKFGLIKGEKAESRNCFSKCNSVLRIIVSSSGTNEIFL